MQRRRREERADGHGLAEEEHVAVGAGGVAGRAPCRSPSPAFTSEALVAALARVAAQTAINALAT